MARRWTILLAGTLLWIAGAASEESAPAGSAPPPASVGRPSPAAPGEIDRLVKELGAGEFETREAAFERLSRLAKACPKEMVAALPAETGDLETDERLKEIRWIAATGGGRRPRRPPEGKAVAEQAVVNGADGDAFLGTVRVNEQEMLAGPFDPMGHILESILEDLEDADAGVRTLAVQNVGKVTGRGARRFLLEGISEKILRCGDPEVLRAAVQALAKLAGKGWPDDEKGLEQARAWLKAGALADEEERK